jgi:tetratricopeptide (TPR) repeat protein
MAKRIEKFLEKISDILCCGKTWKCFRNEKEEGIGGDDAEEEAMNLRGLLIGLLVAGILVLSGMDRSGYAQAPEESVPIYEGLGRHHYSVSTEEPKAQRYFDQGLILAYGFNHAEAARSFREAQRLDPNCAMCYWGEALVLGPNINAPMAPSAVPQAYAAVQKALELQDQASEKERALIQALAKRYSKEVLQDRTTLDEAYAEAMRKVAQQFPDDAVIGALLAESLMDLHPWNFWRKGGEPQPWTPEIASILETVMDNNANHPLAHHLYIHLMEASPHPEKALPSAERLPALVPGSGHLVHMPAHIYIRVGRYRDAIYANQRAVMVDELYLDHPHEESIYTAAYVPHNHHFLWAAAIKIGQRELAMQAALDTAAQVTPELMKDSGFGGTLQHFWILPLYTKALFGNWEKILTEPKPPADLKYPTAIWHYARGLALVRQGRVDAAKQELTRLSEIVKDPAVADLTIFDLNDVLDILKIAEAVLAGELAAEQGDFETSIRHLQSAVNLEDGLNYTEPKDWYLPSRQVLGSILLEAGKAAEAEKVFREDLQDHPQSGWSLFGLEQSLRAQGKLREAEVVHQEFREVWSDSKVTLTKARF